jgi:aminoglycoside phosphotransferase (APT) family kinase protein
LDYGQKLEMVLKDLSPSSLLATANQVRPHFLYEPLREIQTYQKILNPLRLGTPHCYGAVASPELERYWLFLERVNGRLLWQMGRMESWQEAARWLARLHSKSDAFRKPRDQSRLAHLRCYDQEFFNLWLIRAEEFLRHRCAGDGHLQLRRFGRLMDRYDRIVDRLMDLPATFIHGEFYPSNVILRETKRGRAICPVDWELAAIGPALIDVAALTSGDWTPDQVQTMIAAYREALKPATNGRPSMADLVEGVMCCQLHISMQLLGWACDWSPPKRHAQNWLRQAFSLTDKLGL